MKKLLIIALLIFGFTNIACKAPNLGIAEQAFRTEFVNNYLKELRVKKEISDLKHSDFSIKHLKRYLKLKGVKDSKIVLKQFILETGHFRSKSFTRYNNLSGMKLPRIRPTTAIGTGYGHAAYKHWTDSVDDYLLWQEYNKHKLADATDYYQFLSKVGYAENSQYVKLLKRIQVT
jgi:hypothetical protein